MSAAFEWSLYEMLQQSNQNAEAIQSVQSLFDSSCFYKMKAVTIFLRWGAPHPHIPLAWAGPKTRRFYSDIESLSG